MTAKTDFRSMYDRDYIGHWDLPEGRDTIVTISKVEGATLTAQGGRKSKKPVVHFEGKEKGMCLNKTNGKSIMGMYGPLVEDWVGKRIALYPTTTQFGSDQVACIRVRPSVPQPKAVTTEGAA